MTRKQTASRDGSEWREVVEEWERSGRTREAFASSHGLVVGTLSWWIGRIRRLDREAIGAPAARRASAFLPVKIVSSPQAPAIAEPVGRHHVEIALRDGDVVRVPVGIDAAWAGLLVAAMRGGARC